MRPNFSNHSTLLNTLEMGLNNVRLCLEECSLSRSENYKFNGVVPKRRNNTCSEIDKTQTRSNFPHSGCYNTQAVSESLQPRCNNTQTGCNNRPTGCNNTRTGSNKKHTIHDHTQEDSDNFQKGQYKSKRGTRKRKTKSRNWSQYKKIADYIIKGSFIVLNLMKYFKQP